MKITNKITNEIIFEDDSNTMKDCVINAISSGANLRGAYLCDANLCGADLCGANLRSADLHGANLCDANLCDANLCGADIRGADLHGANLCDANLSGANLSGAKTFLLSHLLARRMENLLVGRKCRENLFDYSSHQMQDVLHQRRINADVIRLKFWKSPTLTEAILLYLL